MHFACSLFSNTPTPGGPVCQACYLCYTKKVFLARVLNQVVKAFLMVSVWACQSLHLEKALFLEVRHGNAAASKPTASGSCYREKGGVSATSGIFHSVFLEEQHNLLRKMKKTQSIKLYFSIKSGSFPLLSRQILASSWMWAHWAGQMRTSASPCTPPGMVQCARNSCDTGKATFWTWLSGIHEVLSHCL